MKIGVVSDTHDNIPRLEQALKVFADAKVEQIIHAGDMVSPFLDRCFANIKVPLLYLVGNNEGEIAWLYKKFGKIGEVRPGPEVRAFGGKKVYVNHIDHCVDSLAKSGDFDIIIYGHTHKVDVRTVGKTLILNPGECCGYLSGKSTVAIVDTEKMSADIIEL